MCWQIKPWLPSWSSALLSVGWWCSWKGCGAEKQLRPVSPTWTSHPPARLEMAACLAYCWVGGCATLFMGNRRRPEWRKADLCHAYYQDSTLTPTAFVSVLSPCARPTTVNWRTTNRSGPEETGGLQRTCFGTQSQETLNIPPLNTKP